MNENSFDMILLDAHGVVFNNPFKPFLHELAKRTGQRGEDVLARWQEEIRLDTWTGKINDDAIWHALTGRQGDPECWQALLETHYTLGPVAPLLSRWSRTKTIWIASNHRTVWLNRRLKRFGLDLFFDRVIVSEDLGLAKPQKKFFDYVAEQLPMNTRPLFLDDQLRNVRAAAGVGLTAMQVDRFIEQRNVIRS